MARFSNGTEGLMFQEQYCTRCIHLKRDENGSNEGCPIWDVHLLFDHDDHGDILDMLIPQGEFNDKRQYYFNECKMFAETTSDGRDMPLLVERAYALESGEVGIAKVAL